MGTKEKRWVLGVYFGGVLMQLVLAVTLGSVAQKVGLVAAFATLASV